MCWSYESSITAFFTTWALCIGTVFILRRNEEERERRISYAWNAFVMTVVALMQYVESRIWIILDEAKYYLPRIETLYDPLIVDNVTIRARLNTHMSVYNKIIVEPQINYWTRWVAVVLWVQPIANLFIMICVVRAPSINLQIFSGSIGCICVYEILYAIYSQEAKTWKTFIGSHSHLVWCAGQQPETEWRCSIFREGLSIYYRIGLIFPVLYMPQLRLLTLFISGATYLYALKTASPGETPSHWCYMIIYVSCVPYIAVGIDYFSLPTWLLL